MNKSYDMVGKRFNRLVVIKHYDNNRKNGVKWLCMCNCGQEVIVLGSSLRKGNTKSCGCLQREIAAILCKKRTSHGQARRGKTTLLYWVHQGMIRRCYNSKHKSWSEYGGRGIKVCKRWLKFENFDKDMGEGWKPGLQIDRKNNDEEYSPENCYWATSEQQARNKRNNHLITFNGKTQCMTAWSEEIKISVQTLSSRFRYGWSVERTLTEPLRKDKGKG